MPSLNFAIKLLVLLALFSQNLAGLQNMECTDDQQCRDAYTSHYHCSGDRICYYSPVSFSLLEVAGLLTMIAVVTLSNSGAVGAGITIMPIIMVFLEFVVGDAIAYARLTILTGSFVTFVISGFKRSTTDPNKFWTSYSLAAVMGPLLLAGSMIGVMIGNWLPGISIGGILAVYLVVSLIQCFIRAKEEQATEKKKREDTQALDDDLGQIVSPSNVYLPLHDRPKDDKNIATSFESDRRLAMISRTIVTPDVKSVCAMLVEHLPNFLLIILAMALFTLITLLRGGNAFRSIIGIPECQTDSYLILIEGQFLFYGLALLGYMYNAKSFSPEDVGILPDTPIPPSSHHAVRSAILVSSFVIGILSGILGVGGGLVISLYMLNKGLNVQSTASLSIFIVLISSGSTCLQYYVLGLLRFEYCHYFIAVALIGAFLGNVIFRPWIIRTNRNSITVWMLFVVLLAASIIMPADLIRRAFLNSKGALSFGRFC